MILIILVVIVALFVVGGIFLDSEGLIVIGVMMALVTFLASSVAVLAMLSFEPDMAALRETRDAAARLGCQASEDVLGKAVDWNQTMTSNRAWNERWIIDPFVPDGWDTVTVIEIPACR